MEADQEMIPKNESLKNNQFRVYWSKICKPVLPSENVHFRIQKRCYERWPKTGDKSFQANCYCRSFRKSVFFLSAFFDCAIRLQTQSKKSIRKRVFGPIASLIPPQHTQAHTPIHPCQVPHSSITQQQRRRWLGCYHCCFFSPQVSLSLS